MLINEIVLNYRSFLISSWTCLSEILIKLDWDESPYFLDDWMQANWELLVEKQIDSSYILASYGFNNSPQCRYLGKDKTVTHRIICWENKEIKYIFLCFTTKKDGRYEIRPPFNYVNVENFVTGERSVLPLNQLNFMVEEVNDLS